MDRIRKLMIDCNRCFPRVLGCEMKLIIPEDKDLEAGDSIPLPNSNDRHTLPQLSFPFFEIEIMLQDQILRGHI